MLTIPAGPGPAARPGSRAFSTGMGRGVGAGTGVTVCDLGVFADEAAETVSPQNTHAAHLCGWMDAPGGRTLLQRPVRPMSVVMAGVLREGPLARLLARRG